MRIKNIQNIIKTCITYSLWIIIIPPFFLACALLALLPACVRYDNRLYYRLTSTLSTLIMRASFVRIHMQGTENLPTYPHAPAIFVMNHCSALDIPLLETIVGSYPHVWMSKASYGKVPLMGFLLRRMHVMVNRTSGSDAYRALVTLRKLVKNAPRHTLLFPEGTRRADGLPHPFLPGFAILAEDLNRPIIPIVAYGAHVIWPKKSLVIDSSTSHVKIVIGKPMHFPKDTPREVVIADVHRYFETELNKLRG